MTVSLWVKVDSFGLSNVATNYIYSIVNSTTNAYFATLCLSVYTSNSKFLSVSQNGPTESTLGFSANAAPTGWQHYVIAIDHDSMRMYIGGQKEWSIYKGFALNYSNDLIYIGQSGNTNYPGNLNGSVDDIKVYNRVLSAAEVSSLFNEPNPVINLNAGLVAKYSFNGGNANDEVGTNNGTVNGATLTTDRFGNANKAFQFQQNQTITIPDADTLDGMANKMSISLWVNLPPLVSKANILLTKFSNCGGGADAYHFRVGTNGKLWVQLDDALGFDANQHSSITIADNNWHHIVITWNKPHVKIYIDGIEDLSGTYTPFNSSVSNSSEVLAFGHVVTDFCGATYEYGEKLDDIRIYNNKALSSLEVDSLFKEPNPFTTGIISKIISAAVTVYPNPTRGNITLSDYCSISITDITGKLVSEVQNTTNIDLTAQPAGIYFITLTNAQGELIQRSKLIKE